MCRHAIFNDNALNRHMEAPRPAMLFAMTTSALPTMLPAGVLGVFCVVIFPVRAGPALLRGGKSRSLESISNETSTLCITRSFVRVPTSVRTPAPFAACRLSSFPEPKADAGGRWQHCSGGALVRCVRARVQWHELKPDGLSPNGSINLASAESYARKHE